MKSRQLVRTCFTPTLAILILLLATFSQLNEAQQQQPEQQQQPHSQPFISQQTQSQETSHQQSLFNLRQLFNITGRRYSPFNDRKCLLCKFSVSLINYALKTKRGRDQIDKLANNFCNIAHLESPLVCSQVSKLFNHEITKVLTYGIVTPNQVCGLLSNNTCGHFHSPLDDWEVNLEASSHLANQAHKLAKKDTKDQTGVSGNNTAEVYRVIHISDTHVDLNYAPGSPVRCVEPLCCQKSSTQLNETNLINQSNSTGHEAGGQQQQQAAAAEAAGLWGSYGHCDIPMRTFEATLKFIGSLLAQAKDIDYIIWTGDIQPHDVWAQNKKSALQIFDAVFAKVFKYLPGIKILPTLGNHEMIPVDSFSPSNLIDIARDDSPVWLYKKLDSFWSRWLPADTIKTITKDGFYATTIKKGLKVVSLNTNFCHSKNFWLFINSTDPGNQLQWLVHELQISELLGEKVHIIGHIPPGSDDCMRVWSKNYNRILRRYTNTITGQFFGHTHNNEFEMFYGPQEQSSSTKAPPAAANVDQQPQQQQQEQPQQQQKPDEVVKKEDELLKKRQVISTISALNSTLANNGHNLTGAIIATSRATNAGAPIRASLVPIKVGFIGPSMTTFIGLNPSFRIYNVDPKRDYMPVDFETYYMNLTRANSNSDPSQAPEWTSAGLFTKIFNINDTSPSSMHDLLIDIAADFNLDGDLYDDSAYDTETDNTIDSSSSTVEPKVKAGEDQEGVDSDEDDDEEELDGDEKLFELYRLFNSYSDEFSRTKYDQITLEEKRKFLCRLFTGRAHDLSACTEFIPTLSVLSIANTTVPA